MTAKTYLTTQEIVVVIPAYAKVEVDGSTATFKDDNGTDWTMPLDDALAAGLIAEE